MNRIRDYTNFAAWFVGLGYVVLWPVTAPAFGDEPFAVTVFCRDGVSGLLDLLCHSAHRLHLPPGLHALGCLSAIFVTSRLMVHAIRQRARGIPDLTAATALPAPAPPPRIPAPLGPKVKPRSQFGLRGQPQ